MSRTLFRRLLSLSFPSHRPSSAIVVPSQLSLSSSSSLCSSRFAFSSNTHNPTNTKPSSEETVTPPSSSNDNDDVPSDVSTEELRQRIGKYLEEGDEEAIPSIFEAILARKLSGKHEDSDDELMEKFGLKAQHNDSGLIDSDDDDDLSDSDEDMSNSDEEDRD